MSDFNEVPTTTALVSRMQVFEPTRRPKSKETDVRVIETTYGSATIKGRLGQAHADVLEAILFHIRDVVSINDSAMVVMVDPHRVRMSAGGGKQFSGEQIEIITKELMSAVIDIRAPGVKIFGHIIDTVEVLHDGATSPLSQSKIGHGEKTMWKVTIGKGYLQIMIQDLIGIHRDPEKIAKISNGISQAVTRFCKTHSNTPNGGWKIDGLIEAVGAGGSLESVRNRRREIRNDAEAMKGSGVIIDGDRVWLRDKSD